MQTQTPPDLAGMLALAVLAACLAKRVAVRAYGGWVEPVNLFVAVALPPANRKSSVFAAMTAPLAASEAAALARHGPAAAEAEGRRRIAEAALAQAQAVAAKAPPGEHAAAAEADRLARAVATLEVPMPPRLLVDDASPERLAGLLAAHGGRIAAMAPEGDLFETIAGRYGGVPNLGVFLRGHAGDDLRVDRIGRPPECVRAPALTIALALQPEVIAGLAAKPGFRGRGLLGRFLYSLPESTVGRRAINPPPVPAAVKARYHEHVAALLDLPEATDDAGEPTPQVVELGAGARAALVAFESELEPRLAEVADLGPIADWAGKLVGAVVRISGLLHVAEHADASAPWAIAVDEATMDAAIQIGEYLIAHALAAFGLMGADPVVADARYLLAWLDHRGADEVGKRELFNGTRGRFGRVAALEPALRLLVEHGHLVELAADPRPGPGRRPSPVYRRVA